MAISPSTARYYHSAQAGAELAAATLWAALWLANGYFTVTYLQSLGIAPWWGVLAHLVISLIEQHLHRSRRRSSYPLVIAVGTFDVYTSALGLLALLTSWGVPLDGLALLTAATVLAEGIAIAPEPQLVDHIAAVRRYVRGE